MAASVRLRACLAHMALSGPIARRLLPIRFEKTRPTVNFGHGRSGGAPVQWRQFASLCQTVRNVQETLTTCEFQAPRKLLAKKQKRGKALNVAEWSTMDNATELPLHLATLDIGSNNHQLISLIREPEHEDIAQELAVMTNPMCISTDMAVAASSVCVGIDPDLSGAIAVLKTQEDTTVAEVMDVPCVTVTVNKRTRRRHDYDSIATLVRQLRAPEGSIAYVEQAMPFPKDGKQGWYITGYGYGVWLGILAAAGFTIVPVQARVWKTAVGICGKEFSKDDSRALASSMFPLLAPQLQRKKDHGRAEALLIAAFGKGMTLANIPSLNKGWE